MDDLNDLSPLEKARALLERGREARREGRDELAHGCCTQGLHLFRGHGARQGIADALVELADLALHYNPTAEDSFGRRKALAEEALGLYRELGDKRGIGRALRVLSSVVPASERERLLEESLALAREEGDRRAIAASLERMSTRYALSDRERAATLREEALALYRETGDRGGEAGALFMLSVAHMSSDPARSRSYAEEALAIYRELGRKKEVAQMLMYLASSGVDEETQVAYLTESRTICREIGIPLWEASNLRDLAEIAEKRGDGAQAQALRAEADAIAPEMPLDPELLEAFEQALESQDADAMLDAARHLFGGASDGEATPDR